MRHLFLAENDYAACGSAFAHALKSVGEEVVYHAVRQHEYGYPHQHSNRLMSPRRLLEAVHWAEMIWVVQSDLPRRMGGWHGKPGFVGKFPHPAGGWRQSMRAKRIVLLHGGGHYRNARERHGEAWDGYDVLSLCYEADLMGTFENEHLVVPPLDPDWLPKGPRTWPELRVGHFPSRPEDKGSEWIVPLCRGMGFQFETSVKPNGAAERRLWPQQLERMHAVDVVIDQIKPEIDGKPFGEWVSIATETAMMGRIPIANSRNPKAYKDTYGCAPGIHICNDDVALYRELDRLMGLGETELMREQEACRGWAATHHSLEATGRLLRKLWSR